MHLHADVVQAEIGNKSRIVAAAKINADGLAGVRQQIKRFLVIIRIARTEVLINVRPITDRGQDCAAGITDRSLESVVGNRIDFSRIYVVIERKRATGGVAGDRDRLIRCINFVSGPSHPEIIHSRVSQPAIGSGFGQKWRSRKNPTSRTGFEASVDD